MKEKQIEEMAKAVRVALSHNISYDFIKGYILGFHEEGIAREIYDQGYRKQEWISVDKRLPETNDKVLVCYSNSDIAVAKYIRVDGLEFWFEEFAWSQNITHWMPLPEPPKGE